MTDGPTSAEFYDFIIPLVREVGAFQKRKLRESIRIEFKSEINLVTEVDKQSEQTLVAAIQSRFPGHDILAEEGSGSRKDSPFKWIIDPLDGTTNYAHGYPLFAISIGLEYQGRVLAGVVYDPIKDELFRAYRGEGAFLNDERIQVSKIPELKRALMATGFSYNVRDTRDNNLDHFRDMIFNSQAVRRDGVAAIDFCYVACGRYDGFWELNLFPWDMAAGLVIVEEAGGTVSCFDGAPFTVYDKQVLVTNGHIHDEASELLTRRPA